MPRWCIYNLFEFGNDLTKVMGRQTLKWGGVIRRVQSNNTVQTNARGDYVFPTLEQFLLGTPQEYNTVPRGEDGYKGIRETLAGIYLQDDFKASPRLTLNVGLRWEMVTNPHEVNNKVSQLLHPLDPQVATYPQIDSLFQVGKKNFQPRFGLAWQLNKEATRVVRAGFGIYHDLLVPFYFNQQTSQYPPFYHRIRLRPVAGTRPMVPFPNGNAFITAADFQAIQMEPLEFRSTTRPR